MGRGWAFIFLFVGVASNILPVQHRDELQIDIEEEQIATEVNEFEEFEIFGGFGYSNSLAEIGVPVVYRNMLELNVNGKGKSDPIENSKHDDLNSRVSEKIKVRKEDISIDTDESTLMETNTDNGEETNISLHSDEEEKKEMFNKELSYTEEENAGKESFEEIQEVDQVESKFLKAKNLTNLNTYKSELELKGEEIHPKIETVLNLVKHNETTEQEQMVATLPSTASSLDMPKEELVAMEINTELENHTKIETDLNSAKDIESMEQEQIVTNLTPTASLVDIHKEELDYMEINTILTEPQKNHQDEIILQPSASGSCFEGGLFFTLSSLVLVHY